MQEFKTIYELVVGTVSSLCTALFLGYLNEKIKNKRLSTFFTVLTVSVLIIGADFLIKNLIENSSTVRKLIDSDNYVEGYWYETTVDTNSVVKHETFVEIKYSDGNLNITGETFDTLGNSYANFKSTTLAYDDKKLFFQYTSFNSKHGIGQGFDQFQFNSPPNGYKGFVYSSTAQKYFPIEGTKIDESDLKKYNNFNTTPDKKKFALDLIKRLKSQN
jgi:hypothetical protein